MRQMPFVCLVALAACGPKVTESQTRTGPSPGIDTQNPNQAQPAPTWVTGKYSGILALDPNSPHGGVCLNTQLAYATVTDDGPAPGKTLTSMYGSDSTTDVFEPATYIGIYNRFALVVTSTWHTARADNGTVCRFSGDMTPQK